MKAKRLIFLCLFLLSQDGECWPVIPTIARERKLSEAAVRRALYDLWSAGFLETEQRYREKGRKENNMD